MITLKNIPIKLTPESVLESLIRGSSSSGFSDEMEKAVAMARNLWQPAAIIEWVEVHAIEGEIVRVSLQDKARKVDLHIGPRADLLANAKIALVSVSTIGPKLDEQVNVLNQSGELLLGYFLDSVGVVALEEVSRAVCNVAEKEAADRAWGVSPFLGPGSLDGWPLTGQIDLCSFLSLRTIGVYLNDSGFIVPLKSASGLIGIGPDCQSKKVGSVCQYCLRADSCWRRRESPPVLPQLPNASQ